MSGIKTILFITAFFYTFLMHAQVPMADQFREDGKIYVVVAVMLALLGGFFFLLFRLDRKTKHLEQKVRERESS